MAPFRYLDKGNLATIGRAAAVADIKGVKISGFLAWITWLIVHLFYLIGFQNRILVIIRWSIGFATRGRGTRLITQPATAEAAGRPAALGDGAQDPHRSGLARGARRRFPPLAGAIERSRSCSSSWTHAKTLVTRSRSSGTGDTGETQIVVVDTRDATPLVFLVPGENAGDAFRHPFRYAP